VTSHGTLKTVERRIPATVKDGIIVVENVEIAEGAAVTVIVEEQALRMPGGVKLDADGMPIWTAEDLAELDEAEAEADRGEGIPWEQVRAELWPEPPKR
jgi:hypothetical protein